MCPPPKTPFSGKRLIGKDRPGSHEERTYDTFGRLTTIHHKDTSSGNTLLQLNYGYDDAHQIVSMDKMFFNDTTNTRLTAHTEDQGDQYAYDGAGRLVTVLRGVPTAKITTAMATNITNNDYDDKVVYTYDQTGNRLTMDVDGTATTYAYNVMNEMTTEAGASKTYDDNGNFEGTSNAYKYDWRNSLAYHDDGTDEWSWRFDAFGRRVQRDKLGVTNHQRSYWDGQHKIETVSYNSFANTETHKKTFVYGERIDELLLYVDVAANPDVEYYAHADHLGSIMLMVDDTGAIQESYRYTEWGEHRVVDDSFTMLAAGSHSTIGSPWRYTGRANAGVVAGAGEAWYDYRARHYRAGVGRFVQRDPMGFVDGASGYLYVRGMPLQWADPTGFTSIVTVSPGRPPIPYGDPVHDPDPPGAPDQYCAQACADAQANGGNLDPNTGDLYAGGVLCVNGTKCACAWPENFMGQPGSDVEPPPPSTVPSYDIVSQCAIAHEKEHFDDVDCSSVSGVGMAPWKPGMSGADKDASECDSFKAGLACLVAAKNSLKCGTNTQCSAELDEHIEHSEWFVDDLCP